jgi:hypothetical protein
MHGEYPVFLNTYLHMRIRSYDSYSYPHPEPGAENSKTFVEHVYVDGIEY